MKKLNAHFSCRYKKKEFGMIVCYILPCVEFWKDNIGDEDEYCSLSVSWLFWSFTVSREKGNRYE